MSIIDTKYGKFNQSTKTLILCPEIKELRNTYKFGNQFFDELQFVQLTHEHQVKVIKSDHLIKIDMEIINNSYVSVNLAESLEVIHFSRAEEISLKFKTLKSAILPRLKNVNEGTFLCAKKL